MNKKNLLLRITLFALFSFAWQLSFGQVTTASMSGSILDEKGEPLPGATILAIHTPTGSQYGTSTQVNGRFSFQNLRVGGPYSITITFVGYKDYKIDNIFLSLGEGFTVNAKLSTSDIQLNEVVITSNQNPILNSDRTGAATNINRELILRMPTISRSIADLTRLTPQSNGLSFAGRSSNFNNITVDGALLNNVFGLSGTVGGQTSAQPISLDAFDQIQVNIAPYDVRQGAFTGAGINAVTRSGTNKFEGSVFYFTRDQSYVGSKYGDNNSKFQNFNVQQRGVRVGGPIIKDKLFFFAVAEQERRTDPGSLFNASTDGVANAGAGISAAKQSDLDILSKFLSDKYNYTTGPYQAYDKKTYSDKLNLKIDWNINKHHTLTIKYNYLKSYADVNPSGSGAPGGSRAPSIFGLPYFNSYYRINNNLNSVVAELNSRFGNKFSNNLIIGYTSFRDFRQAPTDDKPFPLVDIENGIGKSYTAFGYEPFTAHNLLSTDAIQISDNFSIFLGKHTLTIGTSNEFYKFKNGFAPNYNGRYRFTSLDNFYGSNGYMRDASGNPVQDPTSTDASKSSKIAAYQLQYSAVSGGAFPFAEIKAYQLGFFVQDEWSILKNLKLTGGLRVDIPHIGSDLPKNPNVTNLSFANGEKIDVSKVQKTALLWSPRIGFNYDIKGDRSTQIRGGTGVFTGRVPFVWISNQASNNGVLFGSFNANSPALLATNGINKGFQGNVDAYRPSSASAATSYNLAVTDPNFKFPQVWRSNLAIDQKLPGGVIGTLEAIYSKDINAVYHRNIELESSSKYSRNIFVGGSDSLINYTSVIHKVPVANQTATNPNITDAIVMSNTNKGYSLSLTAQLQKTFTSGFYAMAAYTYGVSKSVNDGGSIAQSIWRDRQVVGNPNTDAISYSNFQLKHRVIAALSYRKEYFKYFATSINIFYEARPAFVYSYTYNGDVNGDGQTSNDLMYIPKNQSDINLIAAAGDSRTTDIIWKQLDAYISQDKYLNSHRGQYAERNGATAPWFTKMDLSIRQDFYIMAKGQKHTLQLSWDIFNFGNLISGGQWGLQQTTNNPQFLKLEKIGPDKKAVFSFPTQPDGTPLKDSYRVDNGLNSRYQMQFGIRYLFN